MKFITGFACCVALILPILSLPGTALAQQAPEAPAIQAPKLRAPKAKAVPKNASEAIVTNTRASAVTGLSITNAAGKSLASLKKPLEAGKKISFKLPAKSGCVFSVNASFADDSEFEPAEVNLCIDKNIRFTD